MCLYFKQKDFVMNIRTNTQDLTTDKISTENTDELTSERCRQCRDVFPIEGSDPNYDGVVSTFSNDSYCKFSCITDSTKSK